MLKDIKNALRIKRKNWELRAFGIILALIFITLAYRFGAAYLYWVALALLTTAILVPRLISPLVSVLLILTAPIGWLISRLVLIIFFYLVVTPVALIRRFLKHDALRLKSEKRDSYWEDIEPDVNHDKMHL